MKLICNLNQRGLSLIELLAVIVILALIAAIAIPSIQNIIQNQRDKAIISEVIQLISSAKIAIVDDNCGDEKICEYSVTNNELGFSSSKFTTGTVNFPNGMAAEDVIIQVNVDTSKIIYI